MGLKDKKSRFPIQGLSSDSFISMAENVTCLILRNSGDRITYANLACEKVLGYKKGDLYSDKFSFWKIFPSKIRKKTKGHYESLKAGEKMDAWECVIADKAGREIPVIISMEVVKSGNKKEYISFITNISHQKDKENECIAQRDLSESYFNTAGFMMLVIGVDGKVIKANPRVTDVLKRKEKDVIGKNWFDDFVPKDWRKAELGYHKGIISGAEQGDVCVMGSVIASDGEIRNIEWHASVLLDNDGNVSGLLYGGCDVTEKVESENRFKAIFDNSPIGIYRTTPGGKILEINPTLAAMLGEESVDKFKKTNLSDPSHYHPDYARETFVKVIEKIGSVQGLESRWSRKDGSYLHVREHAVAVKDSNGKTIYYEGTVEDITREKEISEALKVREQFASLVALIATRCVNLTPNEVDDGIRNGLKDLCDFMEVERGYIFLFSDDFKTMENSHSWECDGVEEKGEDFGQIAVDSFAWTMNQIKDRKVVHIPKVKNLPRAASAEKAEYDSEDIHSLIMIPLVYAGKVCGFMGFDSIWKEYSWGNDSISLLMIVGEIFSGVLEKRKMEENLNYRVEIEEIISSISARFVNVSIDKIDKTIDLSLRDIGEFLGVDHVSVFVLNDDRKGISRTHLWHAGDIEYMDSDKVAYKFPENKLTWTCKLMQRNEPLNAPDIEDLPPQADGEKIFMRKLGIKSTLCIPFFWGNERMGWVGLSMIREKRTWVEDTIGFLKVIGEIFAAVLARKEAEDRLESERVLINALLDTVSDRIYFKDRNSRFIRVNKSLARAHGLMSPDDAIGKTDSDFFSDKDAEEWRKTEEEIIKTGKPWIGDEAKETWADGSVTWAASLKAPLYSLKGDKIVGTLGISRDITARKEAEEARRKIETKMQHSQKLESLGVLSSGIAHDFNNLLMGILGNVELALMNIPADSKCRENIQQIEEVTLRASELANQMLAYSGKSKLTNKPVDVCHLVRDLGSLMKVSISKKVSLSQKISSDIPMMVEGDEVQIRQVVMNLITNASDAIGDVAGTITVKVSGVSCDDNYLSSGFVGEKLKSGDFVCVEVSDTGCGMSKETLEKIFDPFFTTKVSCRGLGLAAVLGIVKSHKGAFKIYSEVGKGSTFKVLLPAMPGGVKDKKADKKKKPAPDQRKMSGLVLVVDDDQVILTVTRQILTKFGFSVITADNAKSASAEYIKNANNIAAVILDWTIPDASCADIIRKMRSIRKNIPILLISGYNEQAVVGQLPPGSCDAFLQKPFNADMLISKLSEILS